jgi:hypothetical protein
MIYKLLLSKERYDFLKQKMGDKVSFIANEIEGNFHWVHFEIKINNNIDLLDLFHVGLMYGYRQGAESHNKDLVS